MTEDEFQALPVEEQVRVLREMNEGALAACNSGHIDQARSIWSRAANLGQQAYAQLNTEGRVEVLRALNNTGFAHYNLGTEGDLATALDHYANAIALGRSVFDQLDAGGRGRVLHAIYNTALTHHHRGAEGDQDAALRLYADAIALGRPVFDQLDAQERHQVLGALVNAGVTHGERGAEGDQDAALRHYADAIALGRPIFELLDALGQEAVLRALVGAGISLSLRGAQGDEAVALDHFAEAIALGRSVFDQLDAGGRDAVLRALFNAGISHGRMAEERDHVALRYSANTIEFGEPVIRELDIEGRSSVLVAHLQRSALLGSTPCRIQSLGRALFIQRCHPVGLNRIPPHVLYDRCRESIPHFGPTESLALSRWWLGRLGAWPAQPWRPRQRALVLRLAQALVIPGVRAQRSRQYAWQTLLVDPPTTAADWADTWTRALVPWVCAGRLPDSTLHWPRDRSDVLLLARVRASASDMAGWPEQAPWRLDPAGLARTIVLETLFLDDGGQRAPWWWLQQAKDPRLRIAAYGEAANQRDGELRDALTAWRAGDAAPACALLERAWSQLDLALETIGDEIGLRPTLEAFGIENADTVARDALIHGDVQEVLESAAQAWLRRRLTPLAAGDAYQRTQGLNALLGELLHGGGEVVPIHAPLAEAKVLALLGRFLPDPGPEDEVPAKRWRTLELQRFALSCAATVQPEWQPPAQALADAEAQLLSALKAEQAILAKRVAAHEAGEDHPIPDPERDDVTFGVFDTLAAHCDRLGLVLELPRPEDAAAALRPGETLMQIWFDPSGCGHALRLASTGLQAERLPDSLALPGWQALLQSWQASRAGTDAAWEAGAYIPHTTARTAMQAAQVAWDAFIAEDSPASVLLRWLLASQDETQDETPTLILILPAELARLPWLARAVVGSQGKPDFAPGRLVLEASVSAWLLVRRHDTQPAAAPAQVAYTPEPVAGLRYGALEAASVHRQLAGRCEGAGGLAELLRALLAPGPAHLCVHGAFQVDDPLSSALSLDGKQPTLPLWLLQNAQVRGDVALSACEAMLVGPGEGERAAWTGAVGIGPLLRARGARTVIGPLGRLNPLASWLFYRLWYEARKELPATQALARAQQRLRAMSIGAFRKWLAEEVADPDTREAIEAEMLALAPDGATRPFDHPVAWTQFTLLGEAPVLEQESPSVSPALEDKPRSLLARLFAWVSGRR